MTPSQVKLYWREWAKVRKIMPAADRHEFHVRALGADRSHKELTNSQFDKILAEFAAISSPSIHNQMRLANMARTRAMWTIRQWPWTYVAAILRDRWGVDSLDRLDLDQVKELAMTLNHRRRPEPDLVPAGANEDDADPDWTV